MQGAIPVADATMTPPEAGTVVDCFLAHPERVHFTFDHGNGHTREYPGPQLAAEAAGLALHFRRLGVVPGDRVAVVVPTSEPLLRTIVAAWFARAAIVVLPHRLGGARSAASADKLQRMLAKVSPRIVVGYADVEATICAALGTDQHHLAAEALGDIGPAAVDDTMRPRPEDLAVLQFSSGSTREPRAVSIRHSALINAVLTSAEPASPADTDVLVNWLPAFHDFGFSAIPWAMTSGNKLVMLPTESFVSDPLCWLRALERHRGTMSAAPPFSLDLLTMVAKRSRALPDLSSWRYVWLAAEPIFPGRLEQFFRAFASIRDLRPVIRPAYGLAEAVVGVSVTSPVQALRSVRVRLEHFRRGQIIPAAEDDTDAVSIMACGSAIPTMLIDIRNEAGDPIPQPARGRIWIKGPSVTEGYWGEAESPLRDGWLDTGDEGFLIDGQLYVCGRSKDTLIRGGVNYDAHEIEDAVLQALDTHAPELRCRAVAVFAVRDEAQQRERVVAMLELRRPPPDPDTLFDRIRAAVLERTSLGLDDLAHCPSLPRTTSGKLQRNLARELYLTQPSTRTTKGEGK